MAYVVKITLLQRLLILYHDLGEAVHDRGWLVIKKRVCFTLKSSYFIIYFFGFLYIFIAIPYTPPQQCTAYHYRCCYQTIRAFWISTFCESYQTGCRVTRIRTIDYFNEFIEPVLVIYYIIIYYIFCYVACDRKIYECM